jgi:putative lipoprotein
MSMNLRLLTVFIPVLLTACAGGDDGQAPATEPTAAPAIVSGTVTYRERMLLPPGAQLEVRLLDVSLADAPAITLAMQRVDEPGAPPFGFELEYDPAAIDPSHTYVVRATISMGDRLMFTTDTAHPVLTRDAGDQVDLVLVRVQAQAQPTNAPLLGTRWSLIAVGDESVARKPPPNDPHLQLLAVGGSASGNSGCNRFSGRFTSDGNSLAFGQMISTLMSCADPAMNELESRFLVAMASVDGFEIERRELRLKTGETVALTFAVTERPAE